MQIRNGDTVLVRLQVDDYVPMDGDDFLCRDKEGDLVLIDRADLVSVEPRPLQIGDVVNHASYAGKNRLIVEAIHDGYAWLRFAHLLGQYATYPVTQLVRAE